GIRGFHVTGVQTCALPIFVDTPDALLVAGKDSSQQVRAIVDRLKSSGHESARLHRTVARPWGTYTVLQEGPRFKIKRIEVKPKRSEERPCRERVCLAFVAE